MKNLKKTFNIFYLLFVVVWLMGVFIWSYHDLFPSLWLSIPLGVLAGLFFLPITVQALVSVGLVDINTVLPKHDVRTIKQSLNYAYHRLTKHEKSGLKGIVRPTDANRLRRKINY